MKLKLTIISVLSTLVLLASACSASEASFANIANTPTVTVSGNVSVNQPVRVTTQGTDVVSINQDAVADPNNSSTANLNAGATFTGTITSTLSVVGIQVSLKTDQNCTVYIDQSPDATPNWDITDTFTYIASRGGNSWTVQAVNSYVRVRVKNTGTVATTFLRLQTVLCPIVEALPRSLNENGLFKTVGQMVDHYGFEVENSPNGEMRVVEPVKLAGAVFIGNTVDSNFWQISNSNNGTSTQTGGQLTLSNNTSPNGSTFVSSVRRARYLAGSAQRYRSTIQMSAGAVNNTRQWGTADYASFPTITDGAYFQLSGTTLSVVLLKAGVPTTISSGSFDGDYGSTYVLDTNAHIYEIYYNNYQVVFAVDDRVLETEASPLTTWANTTTLFVWMANINSGGLATNHTMSVRAASIDRLGPLLTATIYKHIAGAATNVCKLGAGVLHNVVINNPTNNAITVYDNITAAGTIIAIITPQGNSPPVSLPYMIDFYTGLTVVTAGAASDLTIIYE